MNPDHILTTIKTALLTNNPIMSGPCPPREIVDLFDMQVASYDGSAWTLVNKIRPNYMRLSSHAMLAGKRKLGGRNQDNFLSRNVYLRNRFKRERIHSYEEKEPSCKFDQEWYPWQR